MQAVVDDEEKSNAKQETNPRVPSAFIYSVPITVSLEACTINIDRGTNIIVYVCYAPLQYQFSCLVCHSDLFAIDFFLMLIMILLLLKPSLVT